MGFGPTVCKFNKSQVSEREAAKKEHSVYYIPGIQIVNKIPQEQ
jgi:hypothetical protein